MNNATYKNNKRRAPLNRTLEVFDSESEKYKQRLITRSSTILSSELMNCTIWGNYEDWVDRLTPNSVDLLILDPPYNLSKDFNGKKFNKIPVEQYTSWLHNLIVRLLPLLKTTATVYICSDWFTSISVFEAVEKNLIVRNRITWEREKGRGAKSNWKNSSEDIWFCTVSNKYKFNLDKIKLRRRVIAPYKVNGIPKDWEATADGNFRDTHPSNLWTDITVPFWSMPENTDHPTQKSEKLISKLILASSDEGDLVLDPFLGSGTTSVVAKKLNRNFVGIETNLDYCLVAEKRLDSATINSSIQGLSDGVFWERNSQIPNHTNSKSVLPNLELFNTDE